MKKKICLFLGLTVLSLRSFAVVVPFNETTQGTMIYCQSTPSSLCSENDVGPTEMTRATFDTVADTFTIQDTPGMPVFQLFNNQFHEDVCVQRLGGHNYMVQPLSFCENKNNDYMNILYTGQYEPQSQIMEISLIASVNRLSGKHQGSGEAAIQGMLFTPG